MKIVFFDNSYGMERCGMQGSGMQAKNELNGIA